MATNTTPDIEQVGADETLDEQALPALQETQELPAADGPVVPPEMMDDDTSLIGEDEPIEEEEEQTTAKEAVQDGDDAGVENAPADEPSEEESAAMAAAKKFTEARRRGRRATQQGAVDSPQPITSAAQRPKARPNGNDVLPYESLAISSKNNRRIISLKVVGFKYEAETMSEPAAICMLGPVVVSIPYRNFFPTRKPSDNMDPLRKLAALRVCLHATVDCVITNVERKSGGRGHFVIVAQASRAPAMRLRQAEVFGPSAREVVDVGSILEGSVLSIHGGGRSMTVSICGVDQNMNLGEITARFVNNVSELGYTAGSPITVKVVEITRDANGQPTRIRFSARAYEEEANVAYIRDLIDSGVLTSGSEVAGTVRHIAPNDNGPVYYVALTDFHGVTIRATSQYVTTSAMSSVPSRGSQVLMRITYVNETSGVINGVIRRNLGLPHPI